MIRWKPFFICLLYLLAFTLCIPLAYAGNPAVSPGVQPSAKSAPPDLLAPDLRNVCLVTSAISAQVGGIVVVFLAFSIQELHRFSNPDSDSSRRYKVLRERSRLHVLRRNAYIAMILLLLAPIVVLFGLVTGYIALPNLLYIAVGSFNSGILLMLLSLLAFVVLEKPFTMR